MSLCKASTVLVAIAVSASACEVEQSESVTDNSADVRAALEVALSPIDDATEIEADNRPDNDKNWDLAEEEISSSIRNFVHEGGRLVIKAELAPYYNSFGGGKSQERTANVPNFKIKGGWLAVSILDGSYRVWSTQNGSGWWNG